MKRAVVALAALVGSIPAVAHADDASLAEALFRDARQAMRAGDYEEACPKLAESERLDPSAGTRLNLAVCEEHRGRIATAWAAYRSVADELPAADARVAVARDRAAALEPRLPWLRIVLPPDSAGVVVGIDGTELGAASIGVPLPVDPGPHVLQVGAGASMHRLALTIAESERRDAVVDPAWVHPTARGLEAAPRPAEPATSSVRRTAGWGAIAFGGASLAASVVLGVIVLHDKSIVQDHCAARVCDDRGLAAGRDGTLAATLGTVTFSVGLASLAAGTYLVVSAPAPSSGRAGASLLGLRGSF
jgi:hypothetical protein